VLFATFPVYLFVLPIVLLAGLEFRAWDAGLVLGSVALVTFFVSPYAGKLSDRIGPERLCMLGSLFVALGYLALLLVDVSSGPLTVLVAMVPIGIGTGLFFSPNNALILGSVPPSRAGMASGLIGTMRQAGYAVGFAVIASLFTFIQNRFETSWALQGLLPLPGEMARRLSHVYEWGGLWSPEMLTFILHISALVGATITLLVMLYSTPKLQLGLEGYLVTIGFVALIATASLLDVARRSPLRLAQDAFIPPHEEVRAQPVKAFGMAQRLPKGAGGPKTGKEVFALYCLACHGQDAKGVANLTDSDLAAFLREGRSPDAADSKTKRLMPGMKNYMGFTEENYGMVVDYLRELSGTAPKKTAAAKTASP
jgi:MFS family permease